jgi:alpha-L-fucosidase
MDWPEDGKVNIKSLSTNSPYYSDKISNVELLGYGKIDFTRDTNGLKLSLPEGRKTNLAVVLKIKA